jgi:aminoglycoside 3-N-acetyltransferase
MVTVADIGRAARDLDLSGRPLCVHASLRSFGSVEGGAQALIDGLLAEGCTIIVATFSYNEYSEPPPSDLRPARNGSDYAAFGGSSTRRIYRPSSQAIDRTDIGAIPATVLAMPGRVRGDHPLNSFTAVGPLAEALIVGQSPKNVYAPLAGIAEADGCVVLMGVSLDKMTLIHLAEKQAGRNLFVRWANGREGRPRAVLVGGDSDGFVKLEPVLATLCQERRVGDSLWRVFPAAATLAAATQAIRDNPKITHCGDPGCARCRDAILGGPILDGLELGA